MSLSNVYALGVETSIERDCPGEILLCAMIGGGEPEVVLDGVYRYI